MVRECLKWSGTAVLVALVGTILFWARERNATTSAELQATLRKGGVLCLNGNEYKLAAGRYGTYVDEDERGRLEQDLQRYDPVETRIVIEADPDMTHMELHTCIEGIEGVEVFQIYMRTEKLTEIAIEILPLEATSYYYAVDKRYGFYYSFVLTEDKFFSRWNPDDQISDVENIADGIDRVLPPFTEGDVCPYVDIRCLVTMKIGALLELIDGIAQKGYKRVFVGGLLWDPEKYANNL
ncbi:MAG: hypothetical protein IJ829_07880 [Kiritimatiellae bacterium]|nr:hypothetical protein [Kiritimatiellia bacterium]